MKKGFTLLEMLGVIILISLLIILVFPNITNTLKNQQSEIDKVSEEVLKQASTLYVQNNQKNYAKVNDNKYCITVEELINSGYLKDSFKYNGQDIKETKKIQVTYNNGYKYELVDNNECVIYAPFCEAIDSDVENDIYNNGDKFICEVESGKKYNFYLLNKDGETLNLILNGNIYYDELVGISKLADSLNKGLVAWQESGESNDGPVTALDYLDNATKDWDNVPFININYNDESGNTGEYGYGEMITIDLETRITKKDKTIVKTYKNLKARLPFDYEIQNSDGTNEYLYENLDGNIWSGVGTQPVNNISGIYGYWTGSTPDNAKVKRANTVNYGGMKYATNVDVNNQMGIRPVISITKNYIYK